MAEKLDFLKTPEFEQRAKAFMTEVEKAKNHDEGCKWHCISFSVEESLSESINGLDALQKLFDEAGGGDMSFLPRDMSDRLDQRSAEESLVAVSVHMDDYDALAKFMNIVLMLAGKHRGEIDTEGMLGTEDQPDYIDSTYDDANGTIFYSRLYFSFKSH